MSNVIEQTLAVILRCYVYKIPPAKSVAGHNASDWSLENPLNKNNNLRVKVVEIGEKCVVRIEESETNNLFLECAYSGQSITRVLDSSRYFVMRIEDPSRPNSHAWIGLGFQERDEAYEFENALRTHDKYAQRQAEIERQQQEWASKHQDLSLKSGQTIQVSIKHEPKSGNTKRENKSFNNAFGGGILPPPSAGSTGGLLPPPTSNSFSNSFSSDQSTASHDWLGSFSSPQTTQFQQPTQASNDFFGSFSSNTQTTQSNSLIDDWGDFSSSTNQKNPANESWANF